MLPEISLPQTKFQTKCHAKFRASARNCDNIGTIVALTFHRIIAENSPRSKYRSISSNFVEIRSHYFCTVLYIFTKPVGKQEPARIPVASGQETFVSLGKCLAHDDEDSLNLYLQETESAAKRTSSTLSTPKPKRLRQQPIFKYFLTSGTTTTSAAAYSAAPGRVYLYSESTIERATDRRQDYYRFWNEKAEELCSSPSFSKYSKQELHGIIDTHWRMHATELCIRDAEQEEELAKSLSQEILGHKLALSAKTVSKNLNIIQEQDQQIRSINDEITAMRGRGLSPQVKTSMKQKEEELKNSLTELKLAQDRLRKSVAALTTSRTQALASVKRKTQKRNSEGSSKIEMPHGDSSEEPATINASEEADIARQVIDDDW